MLSTEMALDSALEQVFSIQNALSMSIKFKRVIITLVRYFPTCKAIMRVSFDALRLTATLYSRAVFYLHTKCLNIAFGIAFSAFIFNFPF